MIMMLILMMMTATTMMIMMVLLMLQMIICLSEASTPNKRRTRHILTHAFYTGPSNSKLANG